MRLIYLHGFRSSPLSFKARVLAARCQQEGLTFHCPQLPASPAAAIDLVRDTLAPGAADCLIGSSLGGYYAAWLAEQVGSRCILLNPAVTPARDLAAHVGVQTMFHSDAAFDFRQEYLDELKVLALPAITRAERYFLIAAKGDELIDWRDMCGRYPAGKLILLEGGDHALSDFEQYVEDVIGFATAPA